MIKMISKWDEKEYELPELSDFLLILNFAEKRFDMNFFEYKRICVDTRTIYNANNFAHNVLRKLKSLDNLSADDLQAKQMISDFLHHVPISYVDVEMEIDIKFVPVGTPWNEFDKYHTKENAYALFHCPILEDTQTDYFANAWDKAWNTFMTANKKSVAI